MALHTFSRRPALLASVLLLAAVCAVHAGPPPTPADNVTVEYEGQNMSECHCHTASPHRLAPSVGDATHVSNPPPCTTRSRQPWAVLPLPSLAAFTSVNTTPAFLNVNVTFVEQTPWWGNMTAALVSDCANPARRGARPGCERRGREVIKGPARPASHGLVGVTAVLLACAAHPASPRDGWGVGRMPFNHRRKHLWPLPDHRSCAAWSTVRSASRTTGTALSGSSVGSLGLSSNPSTLFKASVSACSGAQRAHHPAATRVVARARDHQGGGSSFRPVAQDAGTVAHMWIWPHHAARGRGLCCACRAGLLAWTKTRSNPGSLIRPPHCPQGGTNLATPTGVLVSVATISDTSLSSHST